MTKLTTVQKTVIKLQHWMAKPTYNLEGEPCLRLKNGKRIVIEHVVGGYMLSRDLGCTMYELGKFSDLTEVAKELIKQNKE